jgi:hypothetical protein
MWLLWDVPSSKDAAFFKVDRVSSLRLVSSSSLFEFSKSQKWEACRNKRAPFRPALSLVQPKQHQASCVLQNRSPAFLRTDWDGQAPSQRQRSTVFGPGSLCKPGEACLVQSVATYGRTQERKLGSPSGGQLLLRPRECSDARHAGRPPDTAASISGRRNFTFPNGP